EPQTRWQPCERQGFAEGRRLVPQRGKEGAALLPRVASTFPAETVLPSCCPFLPSFRTLQSDDAANNLRSCLGDLEQPQRCLGGLPLTLLPTLNCLWRDVQHTGEDSLRHAKHLTQAEDIRGAQFRWATGNLGGAQVQLATGKLNPFLQPSLQPFAQ